MTWVGSTEMALSQMAPHWIESPVSVVEPDGLTAMGAQMQAQGFLWVQLEPPGPHYRGRLGLYIEECIEAQLEERGALPPGIQASTGLDASLSDQLYRARLVEWRGIALGIPSLEGIANLGRTLDAEDSSVLRWWMVATSDRPVRLVVSSENRLLRVYPSPVFFETLFEVAPETASPLPPSVAMAESARSMELSDLPPAVRSLDESGLVEEELEAESSPLSSEVSLSDELGLQSQVEMPELDAALGLTPRALAAQAVEAEEHSFAEEAESVFAAEKIAEEEGAAEKCVAESAAEAPQEVEASQAEELDSLEAEVQSESREELLEASADEQPLTAETSCESFESGESEAARSGDERTQSGAEAEWTQKPSNDELTVAERSVASELGQLFDAEEFLRVLGESPAPSAAEQQSAQQQSAAEQQTMVSSEEQGVPAEETAEVSLAPQLVADAEPAHKTEDEAQGSWVESVEEAQVAPAAPAEPTPLPTKVIPRAPFIRLAEPEELGGSTEQVGSGAGARLKPRPPVPQKPIISGASRLSPPESEEEAPSARLPEQKPIISGVFRGAGAEPEERSVTQELPVEPVRAQEPIVSAEPVVAPGQARLPEQKPIISGAQRPAVRVAPPVVEQSGEEDAFVQLARREWRTWQTNLEAARGPKPLAVIERMFVTDYTRLREAVRRGIADSSVNETLDAWQESFSTSYAEAFDALRVRGKRPTMVLDLPEMAQRLGRLQGARRVQLLLVDGLRFDLGLMVQEKMRSLVDAALTERLLLWSALPTITSYQLELLGQGAEGLKEQCREEESPALVARGRAALTPRRVRTGRLELLKIDVVEDALREVGEPVLQRLDAIAERTAEAVADHMNKQAPRTLVVVFGDHGFLLDPEAVGTTEEVRQGGSSPEEVLVPAFAWLTGSIH